MNIEEDGMEKSVLAAKDRLGYVHIGESHRGYLGTGNVNFEVFFNALKKINYQGPMTFESFSSEVVDPNLSNTLCVWRNLWNDSDDLAQKALQFMKQHY
jgi:D-psicose/D-tagatose/L-ribulose 3-epimerase